MNNIFWGKSQTTHIFNDNIGTIYFGRDGVVALGEYRVR